jgi:PPOX class probable F420-dependent enzyme
MASIPDGYVDLFESEAIAHFGTLMPNGLPHITPVWVGHDGDDALVNTASGRQKARNVRNDPRAGLSVTDPDDPYRWLSLYGEVAEVTTEGAVDHIHELSRRYTGEDYGNLGEEAGERVIIRVRPDRVMTG